MTVKNEKLENDIRENGKRLAEIATIKFEELSDIEILNILAERKRLLELKREYEALREEEEERALLEKRLLEQSEAIEKQKETLVAAVSMPGTETSRGKTRPGGFRESLKEEFGGETIGEEIPENSELRRYLTQLKNNTGSLGTLLQEMPADAKKNKAFMLAVAEFDPAYAMHYADQELKRNEDFNLRVAAMKNPRNSGNALAEMLPEARTSRVVLAAVKEDYRNIRFIQPNMEDYDEMINIAKKAALEKIKELKNAADAMLLVPRPLQQDARFMEEVRTITITTN